MSKQNQFKVGDVVNLKSGGPEMTVQSITLNPTSYRCQWFAGKKLESGNFAEESLQPYKPEVE